MSSPEDGSRCKGRVRTGFGWSDQFGNWPRNLWGFCTVEAGQHTSTTVPNQFTGLLLADQEATQLPNLVNWSVSCQWQSRAWGADGSPLAWALRSRLADLTIKCENINFTLASASYCTFVQWELDLNHNLWLCPSFGKYCNFSGIWMEVCSGWFCRIVRSTHSARSCNFFCHTE